MSRAATALFGAGGLDEVALYNRALSAGDDRRPLRARSDEQGADGLASRPPRTRSTPGQTVSFNASASSDPDGTIAKYEWDLDGNGSYETDTGTTPTATSSYATAGDRRRSACG